MRALKKINKAWLAALIVVCALAFCITGPGQDGAKKLSANWPMIGGTQGNSHYSNLKQINRSNVAKLQMAWKFDTGHQAELRRRRLLWTAFFMRLLPRYRRLLSMRQPESSCGSSTPDQRDRDPTAESRIGAKARKSDSSWA